MNIVGLSAFYHDSACCLFKNGRLIAASSEERFTRLKNDRRLPVHAYRYCLNAGNLTPADVDAIAYYEDPYLKAERQMQSGHLQSLNLLPLNLLPLNLLQPIDPQRPERMIREYLGYNGPILTFPHHLSHAASAYYFSGFDHAALLTIDGVGEWATTSYGHGSNDDVTLFEEVHFPHSLGLFYASLTAYLGFKVNSGEYKVMGLAAYGKPRFAAKIRQLIDSKPGGQFTLNMRYFDFADQQQMFSEELCHLLGQPPRRPEGPISSFHCDVAQSVQTVLEEILLEKVDYLSTQIDSPNLCLAGGVALNAVANGRIRRESHFANLFIQPAAGDAGASLGAAALAHRQLTGRRPSQTSLPHVYLGPRYSRPQLVKIMRSISIEAEDFGGRKEALYSTVAQHLADGKVVGWFQGGAEFGPRALGGRSILADPRRADMQDKINRHVKQREGFRPFAPAVLHEFASEHFDLQGDFPFMIETCRVTSPLGLPAVTHIDGTARPQTVDPNHTLAFASLLQAFYQLTNCPILLNTSFNLYNEPIVSTPIDAIFCFIRAHLDLLVLEDFVLDRDKMPENLPQLLTHWQTAPPFAFGKPRSAVPDTIYTFV